MADLDVLRSDFQTRLLQRLPASLWDQAPETVQGQLYDALASEMARWREAWGVVRDCTLLQRAAGVDLDLLLHDYRLKRYNHRSDAFAREVARLVLWTPKGTLYSLQDIAQLLVDTPQLCGRSGRHQPHWWTAITRPLSMARSYWQLGDQDGKVWYLSLEANSLTVSDYPPPGANMTPWPDGYTPVLAGPPPFAGGMDDVMPLYWCHVPDDTGTQWYLSIGTGGEVAVSRERPGPEAGTTQFLQLWDGAGEVWDVQVERTDSSLSVIPLSTPNYATTYWTVVDELGNPWVLGMREGALVLMEPPAPLLWLETTPGGLPLRWWQLTVEGAPPRYAHVRHDPLVLITDTPPVGEGTDVPLLLRDSEDQRLWAGILDTTGRELELHPAPEPETISGDPIVIRDPQHIGQYWCLHDSAGMPWYLWHSDAGAWRVSTEAPASLHDATPAGGPYTWLRLERLDHSAEAVWVADGPRLDVGRPPPPGLGTATPSVTGDRYGVLWQDGITPSGALGTSTMPPVDFTQAPTCLILNDHTGQRWFVRVHPRTGAVLLSQVLDPDVIPWQPVGELGWLSAPDPHAGLPRYIMVTHTHTLGVRHAPAVGQPWGLEARACPIFDTEGFPWLLTIGLDGSVRPSRQQKPWTPGVFPTLFARECIEALRHVEAGGSLTTLWAV